MINRKALWISILVLFAMIAANLWRLSLLPDWRHVPVEGPGSSLTIPVLGFFSPVLALLFTIGVLFSRKWLRSGTEEAVRPWRNWYGLLLLFNTAMAASAQAFNLARSLGGLQFVDRLTLAHVIFVAVGLFMMMIGNNLPKMPRLTARFGPLDPWQWNQHKRFAGKLAVILGLFFAVGMPQLPIKMVFPVAISLALTIVAASSWHRAKVRGLSSPRP